MIAGSGFVLLDISKGRGQYLGRLLCTSSSFLDGGGYPVTKINLRKGELRSFVNRVNTDPIARLQFLVDPEKALDEAGIKLSDEAMSELRPLVYEYVRSFPNIALLPTGLSSKRKRRGGDWDEYGDGPVAFV